jgi:hypothetical protein
MDMRLEVISEAVEIIEREQRLKKGENKKVIRQQCNLIIDYARELKRAYADEP